MTVTTQSNWETISKKEFEELPSNKKWLMLCFARNKVIEKKREITILEGTNKALNKKMQTQREQK